MENDGECTHHVGQKGYRVFGHAITDRQANILALKEDCVNYIRELAGLKTDNVGPGVPAVVPPEIKEECVYLITELEKIE